MTNFLYNSTKAKRYKEMQLTNNVHVNGTECRNCRIMCLLLSSKWLSINASPVVFSTGTKVLFCCIMRHCAGPSRIIVFLEMHLSAKLAPVEAENVFRFNVKRICVHGFLNNNGHIWDIIASTSSTIVLWEQNIFFKGF